MRFKLRGFYNGDEGPETGLDYEKNSKMTFHPYNVRLYVSEKDE